MKRQEEEQERGREVQESQLSLRLSRRALLTKSALAGLAVMVPGLLDTKWAAAAAFGAHSSSSTTTVLQVCTIPLLGSVSENILHTIRYADGHWEPQFGNVNDEESNGDLRFLGVDCAGLNGNLHVCALSTSSTLWHTIRYADGHWEPQFGNVNAQESNGNSLSFLIVGCSVTATNKLHVCAIDGTGPVAGIGKIWHTIRYADGHWEPQFGDVNAQESNGSLRFQSVDCATVSENLHVCAIDKNGVLWHTIRHADGHWEPKFGNVNAQESNGSLRFFDVGCAVIGGDLHVCATDKNGVLWHTIRHANGHWEPQFGNVNARESNGSLRFQAVDCANVADTLHVVSQEQSHGLLWHTIRYADGHWEPKFRNVNAQESNGNIGAPYAYVGISGS